MIPISTATNKAGTPIVVPLPSGALAITPDGKTVLAGGRTTVTPISTATNTAGPSFEVCDGPSKIVVTPDGKTAYLLCDGSGGVMPISVATDTAGRPIRGLHSGTDALVIAP